MKKIGLLLILGGGLGVVFSLGADVVGIGKSGLQALQILGIQAGVFLAVFGWGVFQENRDQSVAQPFSLKPFFAFIGQIPLAVWLWAGFLLVYACLFVPPVFLNKDLRLYYFINYIPDKYPIGVDIKNLTEYAFRWYTAGQSPYLDFFSPYPPFSNFFASALVLFGYPKVFYLVLMINYLAFFGIAVAYFLAVFRTLRMDVAAISFFLGTGLFSYGLLFELERGQLNLLVMFFAILAVVLFYYRPAFRLLAYLLFSMAVQIKIFPVFLVFMFVEDWHAWRASLKRLIGLGLLNVAALFLMGYQEFINFLASISKRFVTPFRWVGNHSIYNFVWNLTHGGAGLVSPEVSNQLNQFAPALRTFLMVYVFACLVLIVVKAYRECATGLNRYLLVASTIAAMLIPSESQDYKLAFLAPVLAIFFATQDFWDDIHPRFWGIAGVLLIAAAYSVIVFPFKYRPEFLQFSSPALFVILTVVTGLALFRKNNYRVTQ